MSALKFFFLSFLQKAFVHLNFQMYGDDNRLPAVIIGGRKPFLFCPQDGLRRFCFLYPHGRWSCNLQHGFCRDLSFP